VRPYRETCLIASKRTRRVLDRPYRIEVRMTTAVKFVISVLALAAASLAQDGFYVGKRSSMRRL
jgi:hypothetical protein